METEPKAERKWGWLTEQAPWEQTRGAQVFTPVLDFVIRTCEIILLTGAFQTAAIATKNSAVEVIASVMFLALGAHLGLGWARFIMVPLLTRPKRVTFPKFFVAMVLAISLPFLFSYLTKGVNEAAKAIATSVEVTTV
jgi:hypothetical protein